MRYNDFLNEENIFEIKMTGKNLSKLAKDLPGATVGLEFEMIVPNITIRDIDDSNSGEPNYDEDTQPDSINEIVRFFDDHDFNGRRDIERLSNELYDGLRNYTEEKRTEQWDEVSYGQIEEYIRHNHREELEQQAEEQAREELGDEEGTTEFDIQDRANDIYEELVESRVQEALSEQNDDWSYAYDEWMDDQDDDEYEMDFLYSEGLNLMSDIPPNYSYITWPYYYPGAGSIDPEFEELAHDFMNAIGDSSIAVATSYHGTYYRWDGDTWENIGDSKPDDCFTIEPDGSLEGNSDRDSGLEFVSPPYPLSDIWEVAKRVQAWAAKRGVYTGKKNKTSMHTNISVPDYSMEDLDYLKAALLLGDEYVLRLFDRYYVLPGKTNYAEPAIDKIRAKVNADPTKANELMAALKNNMNAAASKILHSGKTDKFTSIHTKDNRIEFRSPGGDYLTDIAKNPKKIQDSINRMAVVLDAAMNPDKYKEEYQKKLYKLLSGQQFGREGGTGFLPWVVTSKEDPKISVTVNAENAKAAFIAAQTKELEAFPENAKASDYTIVRKSETKNDKDFLNLFTRYAAGEMTRDALKGHMKSKKTARELAKDARTKPYVWKVTAKYNSVNVIATGEKDAKEQAREEWGVSPNSPVMDSWEVEPLRPATVPNWFVRPTGQPGKEVQVGAVDWAAAITRAIEMRPDIFGGLATNEIEVRSSDAGSDSEPVNTIHRGSSNTDSNERGTWAVYRISDNVRIKYNDQYIEFRDMTRSDAARSLNSLISNSPNRSRITPSQFELRRIDQPQRDERVDWVITRADNGEFVERVTGTRAEAEEYALNRYGTRFVFDLRKASDTQRNDPSSELNTWYAIQNRNTGEVINRFQSYPLAADGSTDPRVTQHARNEVNRRGLDTNDFIVRQGENPADLPVPSGVVPTTFELYRISDGRTVTAPAGNPIRFQARNVEDAASKIERYVRDFNLGAPQLFDVRSVLEVPAHTVQTTQRSEPEQMWRVYDGRDQGTTVGRFRSTASQAQRNFNAYLQGVSDNYRPNLEYELDTAQQPQPGSTQDIQQQRAQGGFTGEWKVLNAAGNEVYRFSGVGNSQADANRVALQWLRSQGLTNPAGFDVLPVMG